MLRSVRGLTVGGPALLTVHLAAFFPRVSAAYLDAIKVGSNASNARTALIVAPTWTEIDAVTVSVREALRKQGIIGNDERTRSVLDSLSWTDARKRSLHEYQPGQVVIFHRQSGPFAHHESAEVLGVKGACLLLRRTDGTTVSYRPSDTGTTRSGNGGGKETRSVRSAFDVCERREIRIAPGDKLLLQGSRREQRLINGQIVEVRSVEDTGTITLADGRTLPPDYRQFTHDYAVTSHASQGKAALEESLKMLDQATKP